MTKTKNLGAGKRSVTQNGPSGNPVQGPKQGMSPGPAPGGGMDSQRLDEADAKHAAIFNNSHTTMLLLDPSSGTIVDANPAACAFYGYGREQITGMTIFAINTLPEEAVKRKMRKAAGGKKAIFQFRHRLRNKSERDVEVHAGPVRILGRDLLFTVVHDVTDRVRTQRELADNRKKFQDLFCSLDDFIIVFDPTGTILHANPAVTERFGYPLDRLKGMALRKLYPEEDFPRVEKKLSALPTATPDLCYAPLLAKDGRQVPVETKFQKGRWDDGEIFIAISRDLTERTKNEETRKKLEEQVRRAQKMEAIGALAGGIAHDFNNILSSIIGYTEIAMHDELPGDTPARFSLEQVLKAGRRARNLVKQILTFSRQDTTEKSPMDLSPLVKEVLKLLRATLPANIEIRSAVPPGGGNIHANPTQMHQVLMNLGANAAYAMRKSGGVLDVTIAEHAIDALPPAAEAGIKPGRYLKLSVADTGPGIEPSVLSRIFDPFFTTKPKEEGTGLGLSMVHGIVKGHGGHLSVESLPGKGTVFEILLPMVSETRKREVAGKSHAHGGDRHILVVDDEKPIVTYLERTLKRCGYRVTGAVDGQEALEFFRNTPDNFDLLITDQTMPKMTGDVLVERIWKIRPKMPVIIFSGFSDRLTEERAMEMGISAFLMKPIVRAELAEAVRKALDSKDKF